MAFGDRNTGQPYEAHVRENASVRTLRVPLTVSLPPASSTPVSVRVVPGGTSAQNPADYTSISPTSFTFTPGGSQTQYLTVALAEDDSIADGNKRIEVEVTSAGGYSLRGSHRAILTIVDNEGPPGAPSGLTATPGQSSLNLSWTAPTASDYPATGYDVRYKLYLVRTAWDTIAITGGTATSHTIAGLVQGDRYIVQVRAKNTYGAGPWSSSWIGYLFSKVSLSASPNPVKEGSEVTVTATLSWSFPEDRRIHLLVSPGTTETLDFDDFALFAPIVIKAGTTSGSVTVETWEDKDEEDETFTVSLRGIDQNPRLVAGTPSEVTVTIQDTGSNSGGPPPGNPPRPPPPPPEDPPPEDPPPEDPPPEDPPPEDPPTEDPPAPTVALSASPNPVDEGDGVTVTASLSAALTDTVTIPLTVTSGTAEADDHGAPTGIVIDAGSSSGVTTVTTAQDDDQDDETFTVALGSLPSSLAAGTPSSVEITITDDDDGPPVQPPPAPTVALSASPNPVDEGDGVTVTASLSAALTVTVTIPLTVTSGTAEADDHGAPAGIVIDAGSTSGATTVTTAQDDDQDDETFTVALGSLPPTLAAGTPNSVEITITDDDRTGGGGGPPVQPTPAPTVALSASPNPVDEGDGVTVTATLSAALTVTVTIPLTVTSGTAEADDHGAPAGIVIDAGSTSGATTVTTAQDDDQDDETFTVALGSLPPTLAAGTPNSVEVTITDDDRTGGGGDPPVQPTPAPTVALSASPNPVDEGDSVTVTASLSAALTDAVTIPLTVTSGTAEADDHGAPTGIVIDAGSTSGATTVTTAQDDDQDDETFTVALGSLPSSLAAGTPSSVEITITDDDRTGGGDGPPTLGAAEKAHVDKVGSALLGLGSE